LRLEAPAHHVVGEDDIGSQSNKFRACVRICPSSLPANRQLHLSETGASICMTGRRFLLHVTRRRLDLAAEIYHIREPQKIPLVMSPDETERLLAVAGSLKARMLLSHGYGCGLRGGEADKHIGRAQNIIRVEQSKGRRDRNVLLSAETLDLLRQWWKVRVMMPERRWRNAEHHHGTWGSIPMCT
jgi:integrase